MHIKLGLGAALAVASLTPIVGQSQNSEDATPAESAPVASRLPWPEQFTESDQTFTIYPPQLDHWQGDRIEGRVAVAVQPAGESKPVFGTVSLSARTQTDASGIVTIRDISVSRASFPTASHDADAYLDAVRQHLSAITWQVPAERLRADLAIDQAAQQGNSQPLRNDPPRIVYRQSPAILVPIDGQPVLREMMGLGLMRVVNTRALIVMDKTTTRYFLFVAGRWLEARSLEGSWTDARVRPSALEEAKQQALENSQVDLLEGSESLAGAVPAVVVSTTPAELVQTDGAPEYSPIDRTQLLYVTNTPNRLFLDLDTQDHYVLLAGRWYRTRSLEQGPWEYVPGTKLPADFAMIPDQHPTESVRESVAGTPQAQEAAIANSVPQLATVKRTAARLEITYDGPPRLEAVEGTTLEYVANAPVAVIRVDGRSYYALDNGVWFFSDAVDGPWTAAASVPAVIYSIPRSSPLHYVTYVRIYDSTPDTVSVGYTPGYVGSYVTVENTVVYGTGWHYRPWVGSVWYATPGTWGFGFSFWRTWWNPSPWWHPWRVAWRPHPCFHPWWGPWRSRVIARQVVVTNPALAVGASRRRHVVVNNAGAGAVNDIYHRWGSRVAAVKAPRTVITNQSLAPTSATPLGQPGNRAVAARPGQQLGAQGVRGSDGNPDWRVFRKRDGKWQRFVGNGQWETTQTPPANVRGWMKSPERDSVFHSAPAGGTNSAAPQAVAPVNPADASTAVRGSEATAGTRSSGGGRIDSMPQRRLISPRANAIGGSQEVAPGVFHRKAERMRIEEDANPAPSRAAPIPTPSQQRIVPEPASLERPSWTRRHEGSPRGPAQNSAEEDLSNFRARPRMHTPEFGVQPIPAPSQVERRSWKPRHEGSPRGFAPEAMQQGRPSVPAGRAIQVEPAAAGIPPARERAHKVPGHRKSER